jgi:hypothetical protein
LEQGMPNKAGVGPIVTIDYQERDTVLCIR